LEVDFISIHEGVDTTTANGRLVFGIFASVAEFERELVHGRVVSGLAAAKARGERLGRPTVSVDVVLRKKSVHRAYSRKFVQTARLLPPAYPWHARSRMRTAHSVLRLILILFSLAQDALRFLLLGTRSSAAIKAENIFLRKQLALYIEREAKPRRASDPTRLTMVLLSRLFAWQNALINVKPETLLGWHRKGFRLFWRWKSRPRGRLRVPGRLQELIFQMAHANPTWGRAHRC
jgi:Resolvase, N terminal domain